MLISTSKYITLATVVYLVAFFAFASGLVNSIIEGARSRQFIIESRSIQTVGETIVIVVILFMGMFGAYLLYNSGKVCNAKESMGIFGVRIYCSHHFFNGCFLYSKN